MPKRIAVALTLLGLITATTMTLCADGAQLIKNRQGAFKTLTARELVATVPRNDFSDAASVEISDTLSKYAKSPYWAWTQANVNGPVYGQPEVWTAAPFTPGANHIAKKVEVAAIWSYGVNSIVLSINNDAGGVPGSAIKTWNLTNLPQALCCTVEAVSDKAGIRLRAGTRYWVVLSTNASEASTSAGWALSELGQSRGATLAQYCSDDHGGNCSQYGLNNDAWTVFSSFWNVAFAVFGSK